MTADFESQIADRYVYVSENADRKIEGFIVFFQRNDHMFLENVAVRQVAAGKGIGKNLMSFCEAEAKRLGLTSIELYTNEKMTDNLSIYPHMGYEQTGQREEDGFNRVYFRKHLIYR